MTNEKKRCITLRLVNGDTWFVHVDSELEDSNELLMDYVKGWQTSLHQQYLLVYRNVSSDLISKYRTVYHKMVFNPNHVVSMNIMEI